MAVTENDITGVTIDEYVSSRQEADDDLTRAAIAADLGISPGYLSQVLSMQREPSGPVMIKIARRSGNAISIESWARRGIKE